MLVTVKRLNYIFVFSHTVSCKYFTFFLTNFFKPVIYIFKVCFVFVSYLACKTKLHSNVYFV